MLMRTANWSLMLLAPLLLTADRAWALGEILGQSKDELKLKYEVAVQDHGDGRVTVEFTLANEGRLKPLDAVELNIPGQDKDKDKGGGVPTDLGVSLDLHKSADGNRVARVQLRKEWAHRAALWLTTTTFDGMQLATTRYHHVIPLAPSMKNRPVADVQWEKMNDVMYGTPPAFDKAQRLAQLKSLIEEGADVNMAINFDRMAMEGETRADLRGTAWPLDIAVQKAHLDMVKLLLANKAKLHGGELAQAAFATNQDDSLAMITALLKAGADVNSRHENFTALFWASYRGNKNAVKVLLAQPGLKLDQTTSDGDTALMTAAEHGHTDIMEMLLNAGANPNITDERGQTATTFAQKSLANHQAIVEKQQAIVTKLQSPPK